MAIKYNMQGRDIGVKESSKLKLQRTMIKKTLTFNIINETKGQITA